jgi:uncharacterized protein with GYD domain
MATFLLQCAYTPEAVSSLVARPQNRNAAIKRAVESVGGRLTGAWMSFGDYDVVVIAEFANNVNAAALALAVTAGGSLKSVKTTPLLSLNDARAALRKAGKVGYKPVGKR